MSLHGIVEEKERIKVSMTAEERNRFVEDLVHTYYKELIHSAKKRLTSFEDVEDVMNLKCNIFIK